MARTITTKYPGRCADCGAFLPIGTRVRWYGRGKVYGLECHDRQGTRHWPTEQELAERDGAVYADARQCEDYPCCGHELGGCRREVVRNARQAAQDGAGREMPARVAQVVWAAEDAGEADLVSLARGLS